MSWVRLIAISLALPIVVFTVLNSCSNSGSGVRRRSIVEGYLIAQGHPRPIVRVTVGNYAIDRLACGADATLYSWASQDAAGLICANRNGRIWPR